VTWRGALRPIGVGVGAVVVFAFTSVYRFNTLGGAFAGFDNDHFLHFAYAKQVQAGERPLKDFDDLALQGAWPYPSYSVSATAQDVFGNTLRTEAVVTVGAVALAAATTFTAASLIAPIPLAALSTMFTVFVAPTLYNYPKVLMLSGSALLIVLYARAPGAARVALLSVLTALAFVFRHDYAVYVGVGTCAAFAAAGSTWRTAVRHALLYLALTAALLVPSLTYIQRHVGLVSHVRDSLAMSRSEAARTQLDWPTVSLADANGGALTPASFLLLEQNAVAWLYYLVLALPGLLMLALWLTPSDRRPPEMRAPALALAVALMFANPLLLRGNVAVRLGDIGPLYAVVLALVLGLMCGRSPREPRWRWLSRLVPSAIVLAGTVVAVWTVGYVGTQLATAGLSVSARATRLRAEQLWHELDALPAAYWSEAHPTPFIRAVQYVNRCTAPNDRVLVMPYWPELLPLADRRFAGGRTSVLPGFLTTDTHQERIVRRWKQQSVPLVLTDEEEIYDAKYKPAVPLLDYYLSERYVFAGRLHVGGEATLRVFVDRTRLPAGTFGDTGLPCFRGDRVTKMAQFRWSVDRNREIPHNFRVQFVNNPFIH
jgi:hypothetical protein